LAAEFKQLTDAGVLPRSAIVAAASRRSEPLNAELFGQVTLPSVAIPGLTMKSYFTFGISKRIVRRHDFTTFLAATR